MVIKHFINRKTGLSSDTKPNQTILKDILFHETDTGNLYLSDGTTTTLTQGSAKSETITNKRIDPETSDLSTLGIRDQTPFAQGYRKQGNIIPGATLTDSFHGIFDSNSVTLHNPNQIVSTSLEGLELEFRSTLSNSRLGFSTPVPIARRSEAYELKGEFKSLSSTFLVGFSTASLFDTTSVFTNTQSGVAIGFLPTDINYQVYSNDSLGTVSQTSFAAQKDSNLKTIEIIMSSSNIVCKLDNETITLVNKIPALTDDQYLLAYGIY